ncbi:MAG: AmmeMemoRadiSam system protein B, partial [Polyangiaceae bacterium]|nr:AmmeMemoRadiSam system protein B [Polyangiaceae bacterium]
CAIVPHGALSISGQIAGAVYSRIDIPSVVVLMCSSHSGADTRGSIMTHGTFRLPAGGVPIDTRFAEELRSLALLTEDDAPHRNEHALEVQLPFLLRRNPRVRIVPIVFGALPLATCVRIGNALADLMNAHSRDVLAVAVTNLSHYAPVEVVAERDGRAIEAMRTLDVDGLYAMTDAAIDMDGLAPTAVVLAAARALGASDAEFVARGDSSAANGDRERAVGYAGLIIR